MKLTIAFFLAFIFQSKASVLGQTVTISGKNMSLEQVFTAIQDQTGYGVLTTKELLKNAKPITISVKEIQLVSLLDSIMKDQPLSYRVAGKNIIISRKRDHDDLLIQRAVLAQPVRGKIVDSLGQPIPNVSVRLTPGSKGATTDVNGNFEITNVAAGNYKLEISYLGFETVIKEITVSANAPLSIGQVSLKLAPQSLSSVNVVYSTGYQTISRERAAGAFDIIGRDQLDKRPVTDLSTALQGLVPGLQAKENVDGSMDFLIRGTSSFYATRSPLIVVDGFPITGNDFSSINPNDVESVTVLKDAAAASVWGARSANGVIVITTKRNKSSRDKMTVEVNAFSRVYDMIDLDQVMSQANTADFIKYERLAMERQLFAFSPYSPSFSMIRSPLTLAQEFIFANKYNGYSVERMNASLDSLSKISNRQQLRDLLLRNATVNQVTLNLSGATARSKTYGSILYENKKDGIIKKGYDRFLMNFNNQYDATKFLQFSFGANLQYRKADMSGPNIAEMESLSPYETLLDPDGDYSVNLRGYNREQLALLPLQKFPYSDWSYNLLREIRGRKISTEQINARLQAGITIKLAKGIDFDSKFQYERIKTDTSNYQSDQTYYTRNIVNDFVVYNNTSQAVGIQYIPKGGIMRASGSDLESWVLRSQINVNKNLGSQLNIIAIAGNEVSTYLTKGQQDPWLYGYFPEKNQATAPPYGYGSVGNTFTNFEGFPGQVLQGGNPVIFWGKDKFVSFYGNTALSFRSKYVLSGSVRSDASNYITDDPKLRWSPLWSIGGLWRMSEEAFMKDVRFIDNLAVRATYGKNGNAEKSTSTKALLSVGTSLNPATGTITATIADNGNPYLRWERTESTNIGLDFSLFKRKLSGKIDLYHKLGRDITGLVVLPSTSGTNFQKFNNAQILNKGIELQLGTDLNFGTVKWNTNIVYSYNWNRVNKLFFPSYTAGQILNAGTPVGTPVEGKPVGSIYSFTYGGMVDSIPQVVGPKGVLYSMNQTALLGNLGLSFLNYEGTVVPPQTLGWINNFSLHGFDLMVVIVGKFGGVYRNPTFFDKATFVGSDKINVSRFAADVFNKDPRQPDFPKFNEGQFYLWDRYAPNLGSLVESSSYLECKEINLQYTMPGKWTRFLQLSNLRLFAQARDLGLLWRANSRGYHPEWLPGNQRPVTSYTFGLNAKF